MDPVHTRTVKYYRTVPYIVVKTCKGLCDRFKLDHPVKPVYLFQRRCTKCECWVDRDMIICECCKIVTRSKPHNSKNRERYINPLCV